MTAVIEERQVTPFGPDAMLWNLVGETRTLLVFPSALIMQTMHPMIGAAVGEQSVYRTDPWGRAQRSIDSLCTWVYGGQDAIEEGKRLREMHKPFKGVDEQGRKYHALNGEAYAWVHGTAFERLVAWHRLFGRPLARAEEKRLYEETLRLGRILRVPEREMPPTVGDYWEYFDTMVATKLERHATSLDVLERMKQPLPPPVLRGVLSRPWRPAGAFAGQLGHFISVGTMPPEVREILGLAWSTKDELRFRRFAALVRAGAPMIPERLRYLPKAYHARRTGSWPYGLPAAH